MAVPGYVAAFSAAVAEYARWVLENGAALIEAKEEKVRSLFMASGFDAVRNSEVVDKIWSRLYQNTIAAGDNGLFKALSRFIALQCEKDWANRDSKEKQAQLMKIAIGANLDTAQKQSLLKAASVPFEKDLNRNLGVASLLVRHRPIARIVNELSREFVLQDLNSIDLNGLLAELPLSFSCRLGKIKVTYDQ